MPPMTSAPPNETSIGGLFSIDPANAVIALLSLLVAILAIIFAVNADKKANKASVIANNICEMHRIDGLMPNVSISRLKTIGSLFTKHYPHLMITSVDALPTAPDQYRLNDESDILNNELEWILRLEMNITNSSPNSASLSIEIDGIENKELTICGSADVTISFDIKQIVYSLQMAQSLINGKLPLSCSIICKGIGTDSYDVIKGKFGVVYSDDSNSKSLADTFLECSREREYVYYL